jgi:hypothetical protein
MGQAEGYGNRATIIKVSGILIQIDKSSKQDMNIVSKDQ